MKEDNANEPRQTGGAIDQKPRSDKLKGFFKRHGKKIAIVGLGVGAAGGVFLVRKNPEIAEKIIVGIKERLERADGKELAQSIDVSAEKSGVSAPAEELCDAVGAIEAEREAEETLSAARIGKMIGRTAQEVNRDLCALGYQTGEPNNWQLTPKGKAVAVEFANPSYRYREWPKSIVQELGDPEAYRETVNRNRVLAGLEPLEKTA